MCFIFHPCESTIITSSQLLQLKREMDEIRKEKEQKDEELRLERERIESLQKTNKKLSESYIEKKKNFDALKLEVPKPVIIEDDDIEKWRKLSREYFNSNRKILSFRDPRIDAKKADAKEVKEKVTIKLPHKFNLQNFFEERSKESAPGNSTFLFRDFNTKEKSKAHAPKNFYSYKLFLDWDVQFDGE